MKKFLLSLGIMATIFGAVSLQSCSKDDDEPTAEVVKVSPTVALNKIATEANAQEGTTATVQGETVVVTTTNADGTTTTTTYSYAYTVDGQTYTTAAALQAALAGKTGTVTVVTTLLADGVSTGKTSTSTLVITETSYTGTITVPTITTENSTVTPSSPSHSGGGAA
ncbi:MAG: hypothetical protein IJS59_07775 [Bacteroidaceae bacterium]|nr:hypothetical protein [Bacteroidaceae bacterium]